MFFYGLLIKHVRLSFHKSSLFTLRFYTQNRTVNQIYHEVGKRGRPGGEYPSYDLDGGMSNLNTIFCPI